MKGCRRGRDQAAVAAAAAGGGIFARIGVAQRQQMPALRGRQVGRQQMQGVVRAAQQGALCMGRLQRLARIAHVLVVEPVGQHHHHAARQRIGFARVDVEVAGAGQARQQREDRLRLALEHHLELGFQVAVLAQQVVQVPVQEAVAPDQLEQAVHEEPGVLHILHPAAGMQQLVQLGLVAGVEPVDQLVLGRVVVVQVAGADAQLGRNQRGRHVRLAEAVEQVERGFEDALRSAAWRFLGHGVGPGFCLRGHSSASARARGRVDRS